MGLQTAHTSAHTSGERKARSWPAKDFHAGPLDGNEPKPNILNCPDKLSVLGTGHGLVVPGQKPQGTNQYVAVALGS